MTDKPRRKRSTRAEAQARAAEAFSLHLTGLSYGVIAHRLGYGNMGNAYRAVQRYIDNLPDAGDATRRRAISHQRLNSIWRMAYAEAETGNVAAMRVMIEIERSRMELDGLKRPAVLHVEGSVEMDRERPSPLLLRDVLPPEVVADVRSVRQQALLLHRALPAGKTQAAGDE